MERKNRFEELGRRFDAIEGRFDSLEGRFGLLEECLDALEQKMPTKDDVDEAFGKFAFMVHCIFTDIIEGRDPAPLEARVERMELSLEGLHHNFTVFMAELRAMRAQIK